MVRVCGFLVDSELLLIKKIHFFLIYPQELQASLADKSVLPHEKLAAVRTRQQSFDMENKFMYDDVVDV